MIRIGLNACIQIRNEKWERMDEVLETDYACLVLKTLTFGQYDAEFLGVSIMQSKLRKKMSSEIKSGA